MTKPGGSGGGSMLKWSGTRGNDTKQVATYDALTHTTYDGGAGYDTLDLGGITTHGVSLDIVIATSGTDHSHIWTNAVFTGSWWDYSDRQLAGAPRLDDTIKNFEKIIGTNLNDYLELRGGTVARVVDGGGGDDAIFMAGSSGTSTAIGGTGSDQLFGNASSDILVGGTYAGNTVVIDGVRDEFEAYAGTILDFNPAVDSLYIDASNSSVAQIMAQQWMDVPTSYGSAAQLQNASGRTITLVGVTASQMNAMPEGFVLYPDNTTGQVSSGHGDDFIWDSASVSASTYTFASGSGHDELIGFDLGIDTIVVPDAVTWTEVSYHGETSLLGTFDGGNSSVLLIGVSAAQEGQVTVQTDPGLLGLG
jgi:Ca2+-binding RTX toxin-like protein